MGTTFEFLDDVNKHQISVSGFDKLIGADVDYDVDFLTVKYNVTPTIRNWGIKGMDIHITNITGCLNWISYEDYSEEDKLKFIAAGGVIDSVGRYYGSLIIDSEFWKIENELEFNIYGGLSINEADFDFNKKIITIQ